MNTAENFKDRYIEFLERNITNGSETNEDEDMKRDAEEWAKDFPDLPASTRIRSTRQRENDNWWLNEINRLSGVEDEDCIE